MSLAYAGDNFLHGQFIFLTMYVDISSLVDKYIDAHETHMARSRDAHGIQCPGT